MATRTDRVRENLEGLIRLFESGGAPDAIAYSVLPRPNVPCSKWSLGNNLLLWIHGTTDARGYRQWQAAGRHVKKGAKAVHILGPRFRKVEKDRDGGKVEETILAGFHAIPVFRVEDTDGAALDTDLRPCNLPPLADVAQAWGVGVEYAGFAGRYYGVYSPSIDKITLATHEEQVFFHELAHAAQYRTWPNAREASKRRKEIAADLAACVLARMYGRKAANEGETYRYVVRYAKAEGVKLGRVLWGMISDVEKIVKAIAAAHEGAAVQERGAA